jgi:hypothetical protein
MAFHRTFGLPTDHLLEVTQKNTVAPWGLSRAVLIPDAIIYMLQSLHIRKFDTST